MTLFYCESKDTSIRAVYQLVKRGIKWHIIEIVEGDNGELTKEFVGVFSTRTAAITFLINGFKTVIKLE